MGVTVALGMTFVCGDCILSFVDCLEVEAARKPTPAATGPRRSIGVVYAVQRLLPVIYVGCRAVRLLQLATSRSLRVITGLPGYRVTGFGFRVHLGELLFGRWTLPNERGSEGSPERRRLPEQSLNQTAEHQETPQSQELDTLSDKPGTGQPFSHSDRDGPLTVPKRSVSPLPPWEMEDYDDWSAFTSPREHGEHSAGEPRTSSGNFTHSQISALFEGTLTAILKRAVELVDDAHGGLVLQQRPERLRTLL